MAKEISVDFLESSSESAKIWDTRNRPLRQLPDGRGYGVVLQGEVLPVHDFDGKTAHAHLGSDEKYQPDDCPVVASYVTVDDKLILTSAIDFSGHYKYLFVDCNDVILEDLLGRLEEWGLNAIQFGSSLQPAKNGYIYDKYVRFDSAFESGLEFAALLERCLADSEYILDLDQIWVEQPSTANKLPETTIDERPVSQSTTLTSQVPGADNYDAPLRNNTFSLLQGFLSAGWTSDDLASLESELSDHADHLGHGSEIDESEFMTAIVAGRAQIIGKWARHKFSDQESKHRKRTDELSVALASEKSHSAELQLSFQEATKKIEDLAQALEESFSEDMPLQPDAQATQNESLVLEVEQLKVALDDNVKDVDQWAQNAEVQLLQIEDLESSLQVAQDRILRLQQINAGFGGDSSLFGDILRTYLPRLELLRDSEDRVSGRLSDRAPILRAMRSINDGDDLPGTKNFKGANKWLESHFSTGQSDDGRLYFKTVDDKLRLVISTKTEQKALTPWLQRH
jgi:hypothetical protein